MLQSRAWFNLLATTPIFWRRAPWLVSPHTLSRRDRRSGGRAIDGWTGARGDTLAVVRVMTRVPERSKDRHGPLSRRGLQQPRLVVRSTSFFFDRSASARLGHGGAEGGDGAGQIVRSMVEWKREKVSETEECECHPRQPQHSEKNRM